jgi:hypothetical protein
VGSFLAIPFALLLWFRPHFGAWTDVVWYGNLVVLFLFAGSGALLAILTRAGAVELTHSDADKQTTSYKMAKKVAEMEQSQGREYSEHYYESMGVKPPERKRSDDKPAS